MPWKDLTHYMISSIVFVCDRRDSRELLTRELSHEQFMIPRKCFAMPLVGCHVSRVTVTKICRASIQEALKTRIPVVPSVPSPSGMHASHL